MSYTENNFRALQLSELPCLLVNVKVQNVVKKAHLMHCFPDLATVPLVLKELTEESSGVGFLTQGCSARIAFSSCLARRRADV